MRHFGLIGFPLEHSFSPAWFAEKFRVSDITDASYKAYPIHAIDEVKALVQRFALLGFNVTIPYKQEILPYLTYLSPEAKAIGAVNCVKVAEDGWRGYNTDAYGFETSLKRFLAETLIGEALVLGTGGSSRAVQYVLDKLNIPFRTVSHRGHGHLEYSDVSPSLLRETPLIVNCSPVGMYPHVAFCPDLPYEALTNKHYLFDLIYNPEETRFLSRGKLLGARIRNGLEMLQLQAEKSWEIWQTG